MTFMICERSDSRENIEEKICDETSSSHVFVTSKMFSFVFIPTNMSIHKFYNMILRENEWFIMVVIINICENFELFLRAWVLRFLDDAYNSSMKILLYGWFDFYFNQWNCIMLVVFNYILVFWDIIWVRII